MLRKKTSRSKQTKQRRGKSQMRRAGTRTQARTMEIDAKQRGLHGGISDWRDDARTTLVRGITQ